MTNTEVRKLISLWSVTQGMEWGQGAGYEGLTRSSSRYMASLAFGMSFSLSVSLASVMMREEVNCGGEVSRGVRHG